MVPATQSVRDALGRELTLAHPPQRIVSLVPSLTETLFVLGLGECVAGRTRYCEAPMPQVEAVPVVGGTKQFNVPAIAAIQPDLILCAKEENPREPTLALAERWPVYVTDVEDVAGALAMLRALGGLLDVAHRAEELAAAIETAFSALPKCAPAPRTLYFIWRRPWMVVGADTYIDALLTRLGFDNLAIAETGRYPTLSNDELLRLNPELLLLSSEPYPFAEQHKRELAELLPKARIELVDGAAFSWYGARMLPAAQGLRELLQRLQR